MRRIHCLCVIWFFAFQIYTHVANVQFILFVLVHRFLYCYYEFLTILCVGWFFEGEMILFFFSFSFHVCYQCYFSTVVPFKSALVCEVDSYFVGLKSQTVLQEYVGIFMHIWFFLVRTHWQNVQFLIQIHGPVRVVYSFFNFVLPNCIGNFFFSSLFISFFFSFCKCMRTCKDGKFPRQLLGVYSIYFVAMLWFIHVFVNGCVARTLRSYGYQKYFFPQFDCRVYVLVFSACDFLFRSFIWFPLNYRRYSWFTFCTIHWLFRFFFGSLKIFSSFFAFVMFWIW